jgi:thymidylate kinase
MKKIQTVVITGGPCSGKSSVMNALHKQFSKKIVFVPEIATILLEGGFPLPGRDVEWSENWQSAFQSAILPMQKSFEESHKLVAASVGCNLMICDRGILDGAAYTQGGVNEFCRRYKVNQSEINFRYHTIINLESLAVSNPELYGKGGNQSRFEPLERAQELDRTTREAWSLHQNVHEISGRNGINEVIKNVTEIITKLL